MPRRHCKTCGNPLHADDILDECVSRLGKSHAALSGADSSHCERFHSYLSVLAVSFLFRKRLRPSRPTVCFLPGICEKKQQAEDMSGWWQASLCRFNARVPSRHRRGREHSPVLFTQHDQRPSAVSNMISFGASDGEIDDSLFFWRLRTRRCVRALWLTLPSQRCLLHVTPDSDEELICIMTKVVNELGLEWSPLRSHLAAGWTSVFSRGAIKAPRQCSSPFFPEVHTSSRYYGTPSHSSCICPSASVALTSVDGSEEKGYEHLPPLDESVAAHLCPPTAFGWKARASHSSKPCRATSALAGRAYSVAGQAASALHQMAVLQVFHACQWGSRSGFSLSQGPEERDRPASTHHQSHRPSHQAFDVQPYSVGAPPLTHGDRDERGGQSSLPPRSGFVRQPVWTSCGGLAENFMEAQKSSQLRHFLPKRTSSSSASSRPDLCPDS